MMASIRGRDTRPEKRVRSALHAAGLRFRLHERIAGCRPDIIMPGRRTVIMVHGCYWHRHPGCKRATTPSDNAQFWIEKFRRNVERDAKNRRDLAAAGWRVLTVWECESLDGSKLASIVQSVRDIPAVAGRQPP
jgi:DNA mismatch endonuclease (patch repair protein)